MLTLDEQIARLADHAEETAATAVGRAIDVARSPWTRRWALAAAAAVVAIGMAAVVVAPRWVEPDEPFGTDPATGPKPTAPTSTAPAIEPIPTQGSAASRPSRFPALPVSDPRSVAATTVSGFRSIGSLTEEVASSSALVGRVIGDELVEGVTVHALESPVDPPVTGSYQVDPVTVAGRTYDAWRAYSGNPVMTTLVDQQDQRIKVIGAEPTGFLELLGQLPATGVTIDDGTVDFELASVPSGWMVVMPPTPAPGRSLVVQLTIPSSGGGEGDVVSVSRVPELPFVGMYGIRRVDVNGTEGWITEAAVFWSLGDGEFAWAMSSTSAEDALKLARSVEFVDEATFRERYDVGPDDMPLP